MRTDAMSQSAAEEADRLIDTGLGMLGDERHANAGPASCRDTAALRKLRGPSRSSNDRGASVSKRDVQPIMTFFGAATNVASSDQGGSFRKSDTSKSTDSRTPFAACCNCGSTDVILHVVDSMRCCRECDAVEYIVIDNERPAKRDVPRDSTSFSFKRLSHFNEWLAQIQGKDHPSIPENVIGFVMVELKRNYINNAADVKTSQVRAILKKLKLSRYYEHVPYIIARIRGVPSERMPAHLEDKLRAMFRKIQVPFVQNSPPTRKNFLSYGYVLHKFVQLLGYTEYLEKFPLLKSRDKLRIQDDIWRKICADLHWEFVPSV